MSLLRPVVISPTLSAVILNVHITFSLKPLESLYRQFLYLFLSNQAPPDFMKYTFEWIKSFPPSMDQNNTLRNLRQMLDDLTEKYPNFLIKFEFFFLWKSRLQNIKRGTFGASSNLKTALHTSPYILQCTVNNGT